jgi:hypothetical protein
MDSKLAGGKSTGELRGKFKTTNSRQLYDSMYTYTNKYFAMILPMQSEPIVKDAELGKPVEWRDGAGQPTGRFPRPGESFVDFWLRVSRACKFQKGSKKASLQPAGEFFLAFTRKVQNGEPQYHQKRAFELVRSRRERDPHARSNRSGRPGG